MIFAVSFKILKHFMLVAVGQPTSCWCYTRNWFWFRFHSFERLQLHSILIQFSRLNNTASEIGTLDRDAPCLSVFTVYYHRHRVFGEASTFGASILLAKKKKNRNIIAVPPAMVVTPPVRKWDYGKYAIFTFTVCYDIDLCHGAFRYIPGQRRLRLVCLFGLFFLLLK